MTHMCTWCDICFILVNHKYLFCSLIDNDIVHCPCRANQIHSNSLPSGVIRLLLDLNSISAATTLILIFLFILLILICGWWFDELILWNYVPWYMCVCRTGEMMKWSEGKRVEIKLLQREGYPVTTGQSTLVPFNIW
jgi:hypothetical protein